MVDGQYGEHPADLQLPRDQVAAELPGRHRRTAAGCPTFRSNTPCLYCRFRGRCMSWLRCHCVTATRGHFNIRFRHTRNWVDSRRRIWLRDRLLGKKRTRSSRYSKANRSLRNSEGTEDRQNDFTVCVNQGQEKSWPSRFETRTETLDTLSQFLNESWRRRRPRQARVRMFWGAPPQYLHATSH